MRQLASISDAYALLGLPGPASPESVTAAFRLAVKAARPDVAGGDAERFRRLIAAYRLIQSTPPVPALAAPAAPPRPSPVAALTPMQALTGGQITVRLARRSLRVRAPAGLRTGEHLRLTGAGDDGADLYLPVLIRGCERYRVVGDDLYMTWDASPRLLRDGGRLEIETHEGLRSAWLTPGHPLSARLRFKDLGLPARGVRRQGHLFVSLTPAEEAPSAAEDLLARFTRVWTPERLAA